jgi:hypothetical protein
MNIQELNELRDDMNDAYRAWQDAEKEITISVSWRDRMALGYAQAAVKFYNAKTNEQK